MLVESVYVPLAKVAELVDAHDSKSCSVRSVGSIPTFGTQVKAFRFKNLKAFIIEPRREFEPFFIGCDYLILRLNPRQIFLNLRYCIVREVQ